MSSGIRFIARWKRHLTFAGVVAVVLIWSAAAAAYLASSGTGAGSANVGLLNAPTDVVAEAANSSTSLGASPVTITWTAPATGATPISYQVERGTTVLSCTSSPCTDTGVADGTYTYHVMAIYRSWTSSAANSNALTVQNDTTPPTTALSLVAPSHAYLTGTGPYTLFFNGNTSGSFRLSDAVTDSGSGPASANFPAVSATGWSGHTSSELVTSGNGSAPTITYTSSASSLFQWSAGASTPADATVTAKDVAGNPTADTVHFASDTTAPTGGSVTVNNLVGTGGLYTNSKTISLTLAKGSDGTGSGVAATGNVLQREEGTLSSSDGIANGTCNYAASSFSTIATDPATGAYTDTVPDNNACYRYQYLVTDNVGNVATYASGDVKVETAAPASLTPSNGTITAATGSSFQFETTVGGVPTVYYNPAQAGSFTVDSSVNDAISGIAKATFPTLTGFSGGGDQTSPHSGTSYRTTYSWSNNGSASSPGSQSISATNNATLVASDAGAFAIVKDNTAPTGSIASSGTSGSISLTATSVTDTGSGAASVGYYRCTGTGTSCTGTTPLSTPANWTLIGTSTTATGSWPVSWNSTTVANGSYTLQAVLTDNVSNQGASNQVTVAVNNSYTFALGTIGSPQRAGTAFGGFTVQLQLNGSNTGTFDGSSYAGVHTITFAGSAAASSPNNTAASGLSQSLTFNTSGQATAGNITVVKAEASGTLTATDSTSVISGTSNAFATDSAGVALSFSPPGTVTFTKGQSKTFTIVVPNDTYGNPFTSAAGLSVSLSLSNTSHWSFSTPLSGGSGSITITSGPPNNTFGVTENGNNGDSAVTLSATVAAPFTAPASDTLNETG